MSDAGDGLGGAIRRAAQESKRYVSTGLPLSPNMVALLKRLPRLQDLLRIWGSLPPAEQREALTHAVNILLHADFRLESAYRCVAEFAEVAAVNARHEREWSDATAQDAAKRRRQIHVVKPTREDADV